MKIENIYNFDTGQSDAAVSHAVLSADAELLGGLFNGQIVLFESHGARLNLPECVAEDVYVAAALSANGQYLALTTQNTLKIWDRDADEVYSAAARGLYHLVWKADENVLVAGHITNHLSWWSPHAECLQTVRIRVSRSQRNWRVTYGKDKKRLFAVSSFPTPNWMVSMHSTAKSANHKLRLPPNRFIHGLSPCPEGIAVIRSDHTSSFEIIIYTPDLKVLPRPRGTYPKDLTAIATDLEEGWLLAGSVEGDLLLLDAESLRVVDQRNHLWHTPVYTLATCEMGYAVAGASDGRLMLIELLIC